jgi:hypothetical protein
VGVLLSLFGLYLLILILDLPYAWYAENCSVRPIPQGCYPWGGEGPVADAGWRYGSKRNYLATGFYALAVLLLALLPTPLLRPGWRILVLLPAFVALRSSEWVLKLFLHDA